MLGGCGSAWRESVAAYACHHRRERRLRGVVACPLVRDSAKREHAQAIRYAQEANIPARSPVQASSIPSTRGEDSAGGPIPCTTTTLACSTSHVMYQSRLYSETLSMLLDNLHVADTECEPVVAGASHAAHTISSSESSAGECTKYSIHIMSIGERASPNSVRWSCAEHRSRRPSTTPRGPFQALFSLRATGTAPCAPPTCRGSIATLVWRPFQLSKPFWRSYARVLETWGGPGVDLGSRIRARGAKPEIA